ncbi:MAG TPA: histidinol dehydrogenase [Acidobacteriota bacterium]
MSPPPLDLFARGRLAELSAARRRHLLERAAEPPAELVAGVAKIIEAVAERGDEAIRELARRFDGADLEAIEVPRSEWRRALAAIPAPVTDALRASRAAITAFHREQLPVALEIEPAPGLRLGRRPEPLARVGAYAPGGRAAYPSSVLMCVVPAKLAGVAEVIVCSPPQPGGLPAEVVLAACELAGADRLFAVGGAAAVAALAYGTDSVPRAEKVVGPGNAYVTEAKRQLAGRIASDCLAGPSELLVIAGPGADPLLVAREMVAQAEHDPAAVALALLTDPDLEEPVAASLAALTAEQPRRQTIRRALADRGGLLVCDGLDDALAFAADFAPEHLLLLVAEPREALSRVRSAGAVFLGPASSVVFGDYMSGTNHVLPTGGQARRQSGLSVTDFVRFSSYQELSDAAADRLAEATACLAEAEGLPAHAAAARAQLRRQAEAAPAPARAGAGDLQQRAETNPSARAQPLRKRPEYAELRLYEPGRRGCEIDLSDNTNLFGQAPAAARTLAEMGAGAMSRYPSVYAAELKRAAAAYFGVAADCIATGCGSDDLIDSTIRAFCAPGDRVAYPEPTFSMIEPFARMNAAVPVGVRLADRFELDADALVAAGGRISYVCRPNNPTGTLFAREAVEGLAAAAAGLVLIDEAYGDFCDEPLAAWAPQTDRVVVLRTMSKAFGLAGLRVGLAIGPPDLIAEIEKSRGPYKVGVAAEAAAGAALREDAAWVAATAAEAVTVRERLRGELEALGLRSWPSAANFVLVAAPGGDAAGGARDLLAAGVGVRPFPELAQAGDCLRVTVGPWPLMERFLAAVGELVPS